MYKYLLPLVGWGVFAQHIPVMINEGVLVISSDTEVSTHFDFENRQGATVSNDGTFYFFSDFKNDGLYTFDSAKKTSYAVFQAYNGDYKDQKLWGDAPSRFYDVLFNNESLSKDFNLQNDMSIAGTANFMGGIVQVDSEKGSLAFEKGAQHINASDKSHVNGKVGKQELSKEVFTFPIGEGKFLRPAKITTVAHLKGAFQSQYHFKNPNLIYATKEISNGLIVWVNDKEYWTVERMGTKSSVVLTLSWHEQTTPESLISDEEGDLHIVRWDAELEKWIDEGGIVDKTNKTVTTPTVVAGYGVFTLAKIKKVELDSDIVIYNAVSTTSNTGNDFFRIENIQKYPNNRVQIFNRWGTKVYETTNYATQGNVFRGFSEGKGTMNASEKLPSGTYYYIINYEHNNGTSGAQMIKKAGYLHLETN